MRKGAEERLQSEMERLKARLEREQQKRQEAEGRALAALEEVALLKDALEHTFTHGGKRQGAGRPYTFTQEQAAEVLSLRRAGLSLRQLAGRTGLKLSTVQRIVSGKASGREEPTAAKNRRKDSEGTTEKKMAVWAKACERAADYVADTRADERLQSAYYAAAYMAGSLLDIPEETTRAKVEEYLDVYRREREQAKTIDGL